VPLMKTLFLKLFGPTAVRHAVAALGGYLAVDATSLTSLLTGVLLIVLPLLVSYFTHTTPTDEQRTVIKQLAGALARQGTAAISGALLNHGFTGNPDDTVAVALWVANFTSSKIQKPGR
jgi:hypothetical protein